MTPNALHQAGLPVFPCAADKSPAVPRGTSWQSAASQPPTSHHWPSPVIGVPVPLGTVVIDLDIYKEVSTDQVDALLGCQLPWDTALMQTTMRGGKHYGFRVDWPVRQGSNLHGLTGFDTRVGGKGYICTGEPSYTSFDDVGVLRLALPSSLPVLPEAARTLLEHVEVVPTTDTPPPDTTDIVEALKHIDPDCSRSTWIKIGMALRTVTDDPTLFDDWSSGRLGDGGTPSNYVPEHLQHQWAGLKPDGQTRISSLFYEAMQAGYQPTSRMDTAAAFGQDGDAVDKILAHGADPKYTDDLIATARGNPSLLALLSRELKENGLLSRPVQQRLDGLAGGQDQRRAQGQYTKNHTENATLFLERHYPTGELRRSDETWYVYDGKAWCERQNDDIAHAVAVDMASSLPQNSNIQGTVGVVSRLCHSAGVRINNIPDTLILFQNGVLDMTTGYLGPHHPGHFTTNILPYDYDPQAQAPEWLAFLDRTLEADQERIALLQEWFGYMISNSCRHHKILFMLGPARSGKGTIGKILEQIVGPYNFSGCELHAFASDSYLDSLRTKTVAFSGDTARSVGRMNVDVIIARLKQISGNDSISFDRKYKGNISQALPTRITLAGNAVPNLFDDSGALASRMLVLTFDVSYLNMEDHTIYDKLTAELAGICAWSLEGLRRLTLNGKFTIPAASQVEAEFIAESFSPLKQFIQDHITYTKNPDDRVSSQELYDNYKKWAAGQQDYVMARRTFIGAFKDTARGTGCRYGVYAGSEGSTRGFTGMQMDTVTAVAFKPSLEAVK